MFETVSLEDNCFFIHWFVLQVNRPAAMKKDGIQTRKRKPKSSSTPKEPKQSKHSSSGQNSSGQNNSFSGERMSSKSQQQQHQQQQQQQQSDLYTIGLFS